MSMMQTSDQVKVAHYYLLADFDRIDGEFLLDAAVAYVYHFYDGTGAAMRVVVYAAIIRGLGSICTKCFGRRLLFTLFYYYYVEPQVPTTTITPNNSRTCSRSIHVAATPGRGVALDPCGKYV